MYSKHITPPFVHGNVNDVCSRKYVYVERTPSSTFGEKSIEFSRYGNKITIFVRSVEIVLNAEIYKGLCSSMFAVGFVVDDDDYHCRNGVHATDTYETRAHY